MTRSSSISCSQSSFLTILYISPRVYSSLCYSPNGEPSDDLPCNPSASVSPCCGRGWICLSSGICDSKGSDPVSHGRGACTDQSWNSSDCAQYCLQAPVGAGLDQCSSTEYCCDDGSGYTCCSDPTKVFDLGVREAVTTLPATTESPDSSSSTTSSSSTDLTSREPLPTIATTSSSSQSSTASNTAPQSHALRHLGTEVGLGVGVPLVLAIIFTSVCIIYLRRSLRRKKTREEQGLPQIDNDDIWREWRQNTSMNNGLQAQELGLARLQLPELDGIQRSESDGVQKSELPESLKER